MTQPSRPKPRRTASRPRRPEVLLAQLVAGQPVRVLLAGLVLCLIALGGLTRLTIDPGTDLLAGDRSAAATTYRDYAKDFGADPMVTVFTSENPTAFYLEANLQRFTALEDDLAHDPRVAGVTGPGSIALSALNAASALESRIATEYPLFVAEFFVAADHARGDNDPQKLQQVYNDAYSLAVKDLLVQTLRATADAELARESTSSAAPGSHPIDDQEKAADAAAAKDIPLLFAQYIAGPSGTPDPAAAGAAFGHITAAYGLCDPTVATALKVTPTCQTFLERLLLDLPRCPTLADDDRGAFCPPKPQWAAVFPADTGQHTAVLTVRLTAAAAADPAQARAVRDKIDSLLASGLPDDAYMLGLKNSTNQTTASQDHQRYQTLKALGPLAPTECAGMTAAAPPSGGGTPSPSSCVTRFKNVPIPHVTAAASLLAGGVVNAMAAALIRVIPAALVAMLAILLVAFDVPGFRRRTIPLAAAALATHLVFNTAALLHQPLTPATLAAIPVVVGLGVDYSVQIVARYARERAVRSRRQAIEVTLRTSGRATFVAALATITGALGLAFVTGIDAGPLTAIPLVEDFALYVAAGVAVMWIAAVVISLPAIATRDRALAGAARAVAAAAPRRHRVDALARPRVLRPLVGAAILASLVGWIILPRVPLSTDPATLLGSSLSELRDIRTVQDRAGISAEVDLYITGDVTGPAGATLVPANVVWMCNAQAAILNTDGGQVRTITSIAGIGGLNTSRCPAATGGGATTAVQSQFVCDIRALPLLAHSLVAPLPVTTQPCPAVDKYRDVFVSADPTPVTPRSARIAIGLAAGTATVADEAAVVHDIQAIARRAPDGLTAAPAGLPVLATAAYDTLTSRALLFNLVSPLCIGVVLLLIRRNLRAALLPLLPTVLAAGWAPLTIRMLGLIPGDAGVALGTLTPLTAITGAVVVALATEFGIVILARFDEARRGGDSPGEAAAQALAQVGRPVAVSALTLGAGFLVLALVSLGGTGIPLLGTFGVSVDIDLALALAAVFWVMLPLAVALEARHGDAPSPARRPRPPRGGSKSTGRGTSPAGDTPGGPARPGVTGVRSRIKTQPRK